MKQTLNFLRITLILACLTASVPSYSQQQYIVSTIGGGSNYVDGADTVARFGQPNSTCVDAAGNVYVADANNNRIRKISPTGVVSTLAGSGNGTYADGIGTSASFFDPQGIAVDTFGNVYVADSENHRIRKITPSGIVTTLAGSGNGAYADGIGTTASFYHPARLTVDAYGNVFVGDTDNNRIRKISPSGVVTTLAGSGIGAYADGNTTAASFYKPHGVAVDASGNVFVADKNNHRIRKITASGSVTTIAGSGTATFDDGFGSSASFYNPTGVAVSASGNLYISDENNHRIRKITPTGLVTTIAGSGNFSFSNGIRDAASFSRPSGISIDRSENLYVADIENNRIRKITMAGVVTTLAGNTFSDGPSDVSTYYNPHGVAVDDAGNVYVADTRNSRIRKISPEGVSSTIAGSIVNGYADGTGTNASFYGPSGVSLDSAGNMYVADRTNHMIRKISTTGVVTTFAGGYGYSDGIGTNARFASPTSVAIDASGNVFVADSYNNRIRKITPAGLVTTIAGSGNAAFADGTGTAASFSYPTAIAIDTSGNLYVADANNHRIRKITPAGVVTTFAGSGRSTFADGTGTRASFSAPSGLAIDAYGNIFVADSFNNRIRKITRAGVVTTIAGRFDFGFGDGIGSRAYFGFPTSIAIHPSGTLYVADKYNNRIRKLTPNTPILNSISRTICEGTTFILGTQTLTTEGTYYETFNGSNGTDSIVTLILSIRPQPTRLTASRIDSNTLCTGAFVLLQANEPAANYLWSDGSTTQVTYIDKSGIYTVTTTNEYGCVSRPSQALSVVFDTVFCIPIITLLPDSLTTQIYADSYNWYRNGTLLLSANNQKTIASPGPGTYTVQGYFTGRGLGTLSAPLIISGIEDKIKSSISIYPNPAQSQFSVAISTPTTIQIINCLGQILLTQKVNEGSTSISTAALPSGIYKVLADGFKSSSLVILK